MAAPPGNNLLTQLEFKTNVEKVFQTYQNISQSSGWEPNTEHCSMRVNSVALVPSPTVTFTFTVTQDMCNFIDDLHGGCAATIIDSLTNVLIGALSRPGYFSRYGVTRRLSLTYFRPLNRGDDVRVVCSVMNSGQTMAAMRAELYDTTSGRLCVVGLNDKVNTDGRASKI